MGMRLKVAPVAVACLATLGLLASPAGATGQPTGQTAASAAVGTQATWTWTTSLGGPIRTCYESTCGTVINLSPHLTLQWSHYADNQYDNRWYYVRYRDSPTTYVYGWIYCGNVTASC